ncbi:MAG TPA: sugar phosphate isomerase/epimerase family protein [Thermomicrobiaceae bacterium]|nr:sugar phosphate isomerase/epimerase family protein [Thermomicrobiaceae bacterium]
MQIGASTGALYPTTTTDEAVDVLASLDFPVLEVILQTLGEYQPAFAGTLSRRARDAGVRLHSVHTYTQLHPLFDPYPRRRAEGMDAFRLAIEAAATLGARCVVWHGLTVRDRQRGATLEAFADTLHRVADEADRRGVVVCLENVAWCAVRDPESVTMARAREPRLGFTYDPFQAIDAEASQPAILEAMAGRLLNVHVSDHAPGGPRHLPPGEGVIDWRALVAQLRAIGYGGPLVIEGACDGDLSRLVRARALLAGLVAGPPVDEAHTT